MAYIELGVATEAYKRAYPKAEKWTPGAVQVKAHRLLNHPSIRAKVDAKSGAKQEAKERAKAGGQVIPLLDQVREAHAARHEKTIDDLVEHLEEARALAMKIEQPSAVVSAVSAMGRLLFGDKCKVQLVDQNGNDIVDVAALARALLQRQQLIDAEVVDVEPEEVQPVPAPRTVRHLPFRRRA
jgi:phage terminase small subunit